MTGFCHLKKEKCITINILRHVKPANRTITAHGCNVIQMQTLHQDLTHPLAVLPGYFSCECFSFRGGKKGCVWGDRAYLDVK